MTLIYITRKAYFQSVGNISLFYTWLFLSILLPKADHQRALVFYFHTCILNIFLINVSWIIHFIYIINGLILSGLSISFSCLLEQQIAHRTCLATLGPYLHFLFICIFKSARRYTTCVLSFFFMGFLWSF